MELAISKSRNIKDTSMKLYLANLRKLNYMITGELEVPENTKFLMDYPKVMEAVDSLDKLTTKKNLITAILVGLTSDVKPNQEVIDLYQDNLKKKTEKYKAFLLLQKKTPVQEKNWLAYDKIIKILDDIFCEIKEAGLQKKTQLSNREFELVQQYVVLSTYMFVTIRNDFADMRVVTPAELEKIPKAVQRNANYLLNTSKTDKTFILNVFKNRDKIGAKEIPVPKKVANIINMWLKVNKSGWFLVKVSSRDHPMSPNGLTKFINKIFHKRADGKRIGSSLLRHIIISHNLEGTKSLAEVEVDNQKTVDKYLHSAQMNELYRKV
jgi:hypothetical protein